MQKPQIFIFVIAVLIALSVVVYLRRVNRTDTQKPVAKTEELPADLRKIIKELEKDEYVGLNQKEIETRMNKKGIDINKIGD